MKPNPTSQPVKLRKLLQFMFELIEREIIKSGPVILFGSGGGGIRYSKHTFIIIIIIWNAELKRDGK